MMYRCRCVVCSDISPPSYIVLLSVVQNVVTLIFLVNVSFCLFFSPNN